MRVAIQPARSVESVASFLRRDPAPNAFLLGWIGRHGVVHPAERFRVLGARDDEGLAAVALTTESICCVSVGSPRAGDALGTYLAARGARLKTIVGPTATVDPLARHPVALHDEPLRMRQRVYAVTEPGAGWPVVHALREASAADVTGVVEAGAAMHEEEVGTRLSGERLSSYRRAVGAKIEEARTWILDEPTTGRIRFKASIAIPSPEVAQLEGVWVAPRDRRQGLGRACVAELTRRLLQQHAMVSLYVGLDNTAGRELYRTLGFRASAPFTSLLYDAVSPAPLVAKA